MRLRQLLLASAASLSAAGLSVAGLSAAAHAQGSGLLVFDWAGFDIEGLYADYLETHGTAPNYAFYGDDDEAFQRIASGFRADLAHPCSQMVSRYRDAGLIEPWDPARIAAYDDLDPALLESDIFEDEDGLWFIPTDWGSTAVAYNTETVPEEDIATLQIFTNSDYYGRISLPDSSDDVWALAYLATGVSDWNDVNDEQFSAAADWLREVHANGATYWADPAEMSQLMASGAVQVALSWNEGVLYLQADGYPVGFQREAEEGSSSFICGFVKLAGGPGEEEKIYDFINSWLRPEAARVLLDEIGYGHSNLRGMELIDEDELAAAGIDEIDAPLLAQTPNDPAQRERQLSEFERIKAGF